MSYTKRWRKKEMQERKSPLEGAVTYDNNLSKHVLMLFVYDYRYLSTKHRTKAVVKMQFLQMYLLWVFKKISFVSRF